jgi:Kef-type K+ transport system membrane component KefB
MQFLSTPLIVFMTQALVIIAGSRILGLATRWLGQPMVVAEVIAGILLGPSLLGAAAPLVEAAVFPPASFGALNMVSQIGLILFMCVIGLKLDLGLLRGRVRSTVAISHASIVVPFLLGGVLAVVCYRRLAPAHIALTPFALFMGVAMSITAFPVLARILVELRMMHSKCGAIAISCAAVDDVTAWCVLAVVVSIARAGEVGGAIPTIALAALYVAIMVTVVRPCLVRLDARVGIPLTQEAFAVVLLGVLASSWVTELIGIHALFGAFLFGAIIPRRGELAAALVQKIEDVVVVLLLPLFFAYSGLRTEFGLLDSSTDWLICIVIIMAACAGKFGGSAIAAKLTGLSWREASVIGVLMNTRGLMELIVLNIGLDLGVISTRLFTMMVVMALVTTFMTTPLIERLTGRKSR